ncbi:unnamed protein product [Protopolystoma xenopodis]|uniref:Uncharacterized protein n=1 Tax=Protopolystoma xenopodis TaxID=117903 RepID=A0A3S5CIL5_9PLAT|nr:unnamed protein product [Protopolystoma xenopodis]
MQEICRFCRCVFVVSYDTGTHLGEHSFVVVKPNPLIDRDPEICT